MPRRARVLVPHCPHHVVQRGRNRQVVFLADGDYRFYLNNHRERFWTPIHSQSDWFWLRLRSANESYPSRPLSEAEGSEAEGINANAVSCRTGRILIACQKCSTGDMQGMTAFARCQSQSDYGELTWEICTVNHRFLEAISGCQKTCVQLIKCLHIRKLLHTYHHRRTDSHKGSVSKVKHTL